MSEQRHNDSIHSQAVDLLGGPAEAARKLSTDLKKLTPQSVWQWRNRGIPAEYCIPIEKLLDGKIHRSQLRPDIYPPDEYLAGQAAEA